uniref:Uncharacterized protein n=1 Tax=Arundo donax TaxID=35708 RepID=A0A0A9B2W9_ARUDO
MAANLLYIQRRKLPSRPCVHSNTDA